MGNMWIILNKEWLEIRQQRGLLLSVILPPFFFALLPIVLIIVSSRFPQAATSSRTVSTLPIPILSGLSAKEMAQALIGLQFSIIYLILPVLVPSIIASYGIVGEKTNHTLEPLLATPVKTWQLLVGKCIAAIVPAIIVTWICGGIFTFILKDLAISPKVVAVVITPGWLIALFLWTPVLALLAVAIMTAISARVNDPRTAQQFSVWFLAPFLLIFLGQLFGFVTLGVFFALAALLILLVVTFLTFWFVTMLFQREVILTRWK